MSKIRGWTCHEKGYLGRSKPTLWIHKDERGRIMATISLDKGGWSGFKSRGRPMHKTDSFVEIRKWGAKQITKQFKTQIEARKNITNYMKKHPKG